MSRRRSILQILGQSAGGVGRHVAEIVRALDGDDLRIDIAGPGDLLVEMPKPLIPVEIPAGPVRGHMRAIWTLRDVIRGGGYDLVHAHGLRAALDATLAARTRRVPAVITLHNLIVEEIAGDRRAAIYRRAERLAVRMSTHTFVPSREMARRLAASLPAQAEKIEVLYAGTADPPVARRPRADVRRELGLNGGRLIVTVARLHPQKALPLMLGALRRLDSDVVLAIVGAGPLGAELKGEASRLGVADRVRWLGFRTDVSDVIAAADVFCLSSVWEAVPLAAQEAVQLGIPVVATNVGGLAELISDGRSGRLVAKGDEKGLADALAEALDSADLRTRWAKAASEDFRRTFSRETILARLKEVYTAGV
jgi:glycosyltransferase involved in cell wall biosynthesis